jgi:hypothetical protein
MFIFPLQPNGVRREKWTIKKSHDANAVVRNAARPLAIGDRVNATGVAAAIHAGEKATK